MPLPHADRRPGHLAAALALSVALGAAGGARASEAPAPGARCPESADVVGLSDEADLLLRVVENEALPLSRRIQATQQLEQLNEPGVRFRLVKALPRKDSALLGEIVAILGTIGAPGSLPALERLDADEAVPLSGKTRSQLSWAIEQCRKNRARQAGGEKGASEAGKR